MKIKCPNCNKPVSTYVVGNKCYCSLCDSYIQDVEIPASPDPEPSQAGPIAETVPEPDPIPEDDYPEEQEEEEPIPAAVPNDEEKKKSLFASRTKMFAAKRGKRMDAPSEDSEEEPEEQKPAVNVNEDGFYDDVLPDIKAEYERLPKEIILKSVAAVVGLVGSIIFLIFYF